MSEERIQFVLRAPDKKLAEIEVDRVVAPGAEGELAVLAGHFDFVTYLEPGVVRAVEEEEGEKPTERAFLVHGGFLEVHNNTVTVLADATELIDDIDVARATAAKERAEERLATKQEGIDLDRAEFALRRAMVRLDASRE